MRPKPLEGIRVLDLTRLLPGPMCTLHLADMGADVVKVEDPRAGDYARGFRFRGGAGGGAFFDCLNRNKRSIRLDLACSEGRAVFLDLARGADVLVEGFRPGVMARLGLDYESLREVNPRLVYCAITGYGQSGPYRERAGHDIDYCAYAGVLEQCGTAHGPPAPGNFQIADLAGGALSAAMGILAALVDASRGGRGRYVDVAMTDCTLAHAVAPLAAFSEAGTAPPRGDDLLSGGLPCYAVYATRDGRHMALGALEKKFWRAFCEAVGRADLTERHWVFGVDAEAVRAEVAAIFAGETQAHWVRRFEAVDCCVAPVLTVEEAMADPQLRAREMFVQVETAEGSRTQYAFPIKMSEFRFEIARPAPAHGEHGAEVLAELGYAEARIAALQRGGVI